MEHVFEEQLQNKQKKIEEIIKQFMPKVEGPQKTLLEAMNYSVSVGGKRLRPLFMQEVFHLFSNRDKLVAPFMAAMEMLHTYSLVHDDLPDMDNDKYRRGRETTWYVYGPGMGILAGDGLLNYAYETALSAFQVAEPGEYEHVIGAITVFAKKSGIYGMIGGQCVDVESEGKPITEDTLLFIHEHKTAALIQASMMLGGILGGASQEDIQALEKCAYNIGIAFQIQDDILDIYGDSQELGKPVGSDTKNQKQTYVTLNGYEGSVEMVEKLSKEAIQILKTISSDCEFLVQLVEMLIYRRK